MGQAQTSCYAPNRLGNGAAGRKEDVEASSEQATAEEETSKLEAALTLDTVGGVQEINKGAVRGEDAKGVAAESAKNGRTSEDSEVEAAERHREHGKDSEKPQMPLISKKPVSPEAVAGVRPAAPRLKPKRSGSKESDSSSHSSSGPVYGSEGQQHPKAKKAGSRSERVRRPSQESSNSEVEKPLLRQMTAEAVMTRMGDGEPERIGRSTSGAVMPSIGEGDAKDVWNGEETEKGDVAQTDERSNLARSKSKASTLSDHEEEDAQIVKQRKAASMRQRQIKADEAVRAAQKRHNGCRTTPRRLSWRRSGSKEKIHSISSESHA